MASERALGARRWTPDKLAAMRMLELGVACNFHELRFARSQELVEQLRSHAERENSLLYRWADHHLDVKVLIATMAQASD